MPPRLQEYNEEAIRELLEGLAPWNLRVMWASKRFKVTYQTCILQHTLSAGSASCGFSTTAVLSTDWNEGCCVSVREEGQAKVPPSRDAEDVLKTMHCWMM